MVATIQLSRYIYAQGVIARVLPNGFVAIRDGDREFIGQPVAHRPRLAAIESHTDARA